MICAWALVLIGVLWAISVGLVLLFLMGASDGE